MSPQETDMLRHAASKTLGIVVLAFAASACSAGDSSSTHEVDMSLNLRDEAKAEDVGLPSYPGAKPYTENDDSSSGANLGLETPWFGFKVVALKLETRDEPKRVAAFYRDALSKYGHV